MKDFHNRSLYSNPASNLFAHRVSEIPLGGAVKIGSQNVSATIENIKANWQQVYPENVFEYRLQDER